MDKRKDNGGHSTKAKKKFDRRKRIDLSKNSEIESFIESFSSDIRLLASSAYKRFLEEHLRSGGYYVYTHELNSEIVYVGKGKNDRAFDWRCRTVEEHSFLVADGSIKVVILANNLTEENALLVEESLIKNLKPKYNILCK